jgi:hypothetical protein
MLKRLVLKYWPMILLLVLIIAVLCVSHYAENRKAENQEYAQAGGPKAPISPNDASKSPQKTYESQHPPGWIKTFTWPEGVTAWALFLTLSVIAWQSTETRDAAKAANAQIKMMKDKERARISIEIKPLDTLEFGTGSNHITLRLRNFGFTHALNVKASGDARALIFSNPIELPGLPRTSFGPAYKVPTLDPLPIEFQDLDVPTVLLAGSPSTETWVGFIFPDEWDDEILMRPKIAIEVRGCIEYDDVFGDKHTTKFSYDMRVSRWGEVSKTGSAPIRPHSPFSQWFKTPNPADNEAT